MSFHKHVLANGLTIIGEISPSARSVAVGFFVKTGARDETPAESGVSHFLEHMVFKGTPKRPKAIDISRELDSIGAEYNGCPNVLIMNHFFDEMRGKERVKDLIEEGLRGQAYHRSGASKVNLLFSLPRLILIVLGILGVLGLLIR